MNTLYDQCCQEYKRAIDTGKQQHGAKVVAVEMANFEDALRWNEKAVKNLKYEMIPNGESVPTGIIWNSKHLRVVPGFFPNFAIELTRWATDCNLNNPSLSVLSDLETAVQKAPPFPNGKSRRVRINSEQYYEGITPEIWELAIGNYRHAEKWLKDRKNREPPYDDIEHYWDI